LFITRVVSGEGAQLPQQCVGQERAAAGSGGRGPVNWG
jgi:hypothetical protein